MFFFCAFDIIRLYLFTLKCNTTDAKENKLMQHSTQRELTLYRLHPLLLVSLLNQLCSCWAAENKNFLRRENGGRHTTN
jgi:hypothetical protein